MTKKVVPPGWRPGQSGNPKGRPVGSGEVAKLRAAIAEHIPTIIESLAQRAINGDTGAARLLLERGIAPLKAVELCQPVSLPAGDLSTPMASANSPACGHLELPQARTAALWGFSVDGQAAGD